MSLQVRCPKAECQKRLTVAGSTAGAKIRCPQCGTVFRAAGDAPSADRGSAAAAPAGDVVAVLTPPATAAPGVPKQIGPYPVRGKLGEGAFGVVYRAHDPALKREVAIKMLKGSAVQSKKHLDRFIREAQVVGDMHHSNIVPVYQLGEEGGTHFIVSKFIPGRTLDDAIAAGGMDPAQAVRLVLQLLDALAYAHDQGVLHRDVKPGNALLDERGNLHLTDFGLAGLLSQAETRMTQAGTVLGTPAYMPPEQASGAVQEVGPAADQYSAGVILFELLTGQVPFTAPHPAALLYSVIHNPPPRPSSLRPGLDPELERLCLRALAKSPAERFPSCQAFADALRTWLGNPGAKKTAKQPPPLPPEVLLARPQAAVSTMQATRTTVHPPAAVTAVTVPPPIPGTEPTDRRLPWTIWLAFGLIGLLLLGTMATVLVVGLGGSSPAAVKGQRDIMAQ